MTEVKKVEKFSKYYTLKENIISNFLRSEIFLPFGLETLQYPIIFTTNLPINAPACTDFKNIYINPEDDFFKKNNINETNLLTFVILHEVGHNIFLHKNRGKEKDQTVWQYAIDFFLNLLLYNIEKENLDNQANLIVMNIDKFSDQILFNENFSNMIEEEIYQKLLNEGKFKKEERKEFYKDFLNNIGVSSNGISEDSKIKIIESKLEFDGQIQKKIFVEFPQPEELNQQSENILDHNLTKTMFETRIMSKGCNNQEFEKFLKRIFKVEIDWKIILRDSLLIELQKKDNISYGRPRLSWLTNPTNLPYLSNIEEEEVYGTCILCIDESGSVSDSDIQQAINIIEQSSSYYKKLMVIKHDTKISYEKEFEGSLSEKDINDLLIRRSFGGTSHSEVFQRIIELSKQSDNLISIVIVISDLFSNIEESQKILQNIPRIYIRSNKEYNTEKIIGKVVDIC